MEVLYQDACKGAPEFVSSTIPEDGRQLLHPLMRIAVAAGFQIRRVFELSERGEIDLGLQAKDDQSPYGIADELSGTMIANGIAAEGLHVYHDDEEGVSGDKSQQLRLVSDCLDGSQNFMMGYRDAFMVVLGLYNTAEQIASIVYSPMFGDMYVAAKACGAWKLIRRTDGQYDSYKLEMGLLRATDPKIRPFVPLDTKCYDECPTMVRVTEQIGYRVEPMSGSAKKIVSIASRKDVAGMFRPQSAKPDPHDIAAAAVLVTAQQNGIATSMGGAPLLDSNLQFYDGFIIGNRAFHSDVVLANAVLESIFKRENLSEQTITQERSKELAKEVASTVRALHY